jgi:hypothetical protein
VPRPAKVSDLVALLDWLMRLPPELEARGWRAIHPPKQEQTMPSPLQWHRLFGIALTDTFTGTAWQVELEKELALQSQRLDVLIIERQPGSAAPRDTAAHLPDGLDGLRSHNLLTYKSRHEPLDAWALDELLGHYVTYRKLKGNAEAPEPGTNARHRLPAVHHFALLAVATRRPRRVLARAPAMQPTAWPGVYDLRWGGRPVRLIVLNEIARHPRNAPWELFATALGRVRAGLADYQPRSIAARRLLVELYLTHRLEMTPMAYTVDDFLRDAPRDILGMLTAEERRAFLDLVPAEERLRGLPPEERLRGLPPEERLRGLPPEERLRGLPPEERLRGLPPEERLQGLSDEERERLRQLLDKPH